MIKENYKYGERVESIICGYYGGLPGRIIGPAQLQYENFTRYVIELDIGKTIVLSARYIKPLPDEDTDEDLNEEYY